MLAVRELCFAHQRSGNELFQALTYDFQVGLVTAVTGASGRGKSTLLYILGLLLTPTAGAVTFSARPVSQLRDHQRSLLRAQSIGFIFQDAVLDPARPVLHSVIEPALYAGRDRRDVIAPALGLLSRFDVAHRVDHKPSQISGGQAQRVALCRALINDPAVILADEPTGNLDRVNAGLVLSGLRGVAAQGKTVVVATHDPFVLDHADETLAL